MAIRRKAHWWELMLPAGLWILAGKLTLNFARVIAQAGLAPRRAIFKLLQISGRLSRTGFNVWRERRGKWR